MFGEKKLLTSLLRPQEGESSKILPNACFFKVGLSNMSKDLYICIFCLICGIQGIYNVQKRVKITLHSKFVI